MGTNYKGCRLSRIPFNPNYWLIECVCVWAFACVSVRACMRLSTSVVWLCLCVLYSLLVRSQLILSLDLLEYQGIEIFLHTNYLLGHAIKLCSLSGKKNKGELWFNTNLWCMCRVTEPLGVRAVATASLNSLPLEYHSRWAVEVNRKYTQTPPFQKYLP